MKRNLAIVSALGLVFLTSAPVLSQEAPPTPGDRPSAGTGIANPPAARSGTMTSQPGTGTAEVRGNRLIGADVKSANNEKIGDVSEVLVSTDGRINAIVVSVGGFLGMGDRKVALPWEQLRFSSEGNDLIVMASATKESLKEMPEYRDPPRACGSGERAAPRAEGGSMPGAAGNRDTSRPVRPVPTE